MESVEAWSTVDYRRCIVQSKCIFPLFTNWFSWLVSRWCRYFTSVESSANANGRFAIILSAVFSLFFSTLYSNKWTVWVEIYLVFHVPQNVFDHGTMFNDVALHVLLTRHYISILIHHEISNWQLTSGVPLGQGLVCPCLGGRFFFTSSWTWKIGFFSNLTKMPCCKLQRQTIYFIVLYLLQVNVALNKVLKVIFK